MYVRVNYIANSGNTTISILAKIARALPAFLACFVIVVAIALGVSARFTGLEVLQLAVDEYYFVRGVQLILEQGVPLFATGGYYVHGLLAQYAIAASVMIFGESGFGYRLSPVLFSLGSIALFYFYSRRFLDPIPAGLVCAMLLVSAWHIEFARFIRMYSQLQFFTVLFFLVLQKAFFEEWWRWRYLPHVIAILAFLTHALGFLLLPFLFAPLLFADVRRRLCTWVSMATYAFVSAATVIFCHSFLTMNFRWQRTVSPLPAEYVFSHPPASRFRLPEFPFWSVSEEAQVNLIVFWVICAVLVAGLGTWRYFQRRIGQTDIVLVLLLTAVLFHMFVVALGLLFLLVFRYRLYRLDEHPPRSYWMLSASLAIGVFWLIYALLSSDWVRLIDSANPSLFKAFGRTFFGWPDFYTPIFMPWFKELPFLGFLIAAALSYQIVSRAKATPSLLFQNPAFIVCYVAFCFGVLQSAISTRYAFFVYPFMLLVLALLAVDLSRTMARFLRIQAQVPTQIIGVLACLGLFMWTEDFHIRQITGISSEAVRFRLGEFERYGATWYRRNDFESPAMFVNGLPHIDSRTKLLVVNLPVVSYYLQHPHAIYYHRDTTRFYLVSRVGGTVDVWSNQRLLSTDAELRDYTDSSNRVIIIRSISPRSVDRDDIDIERIWKDRLVSTQRLFTSSDNRIEVVSLTLRAPEIINAEP